MPWGIVDHGLLSELKTANAYSSEGGLAPPLLPALFSCTVPYGLRPSDLETYVLFAAAEYILVTRDTAFLSEAVVPYNSTRPVAVAELLQSAFHYRTQVIGTGPHGLMRVQGSDWSDSFCRCVPLALGCRFSSAIFASLTARCPAASSTTRSGGISTILASLFSSPVRRRMRCSALHKRSSSPVRPTRLLLRMRAVLPGSRWAVAPCRVPRDGRVHLSALCAQVAALREYGLASGGPWLRRSWLPGLPPPGFQGDDSIEITQQPWHVLAGVFNASINAGVAAAVKRNLSDPSPIGPAIMSAPYGPSAGPPGVQENGGVWQGSLNQPWVWALTTINATDAWEQWLLNTLAAEAEAYGDAVWAGIWTSSDAVNSFLAQRPGLPSWDTFPVLCTHRHAWPLYALTKLAGVGFDATGLVLAPPAQPRVLLCGATRVGAGSDAPLWSLDTPVVSVAAFPNGTWRGRYSPPVPTGGHGGVLPPQARFSARLPLQMPTGSDCETGWIATRAFNWTASVSIRAYHCDAVDYATNSVAMSATVRAPTVEEEHVWSASAPVAAVIEFSAAPPSRSFAWEVAVFRA